MGRLYRSRPDLNHKNKNMRTAYLIRHSGEKLPELVAHGLVPTIKKQFVSADIKAGDELVMIGDGIRTKRRGKTGDMDAHFALVAKENQAMRDAWAKEKKAPAVKALSPAEHAKAVAAADARKSPDVLAIKAQLNKKNAAPAPAKK